jgi:hypothetical protein
MVTEEGEKQRQLGPTITVTVTALATLGRKARSGAIITTIIAMRSEEVFMTSISHRTIANNPLPPARRQK